MNRRAYTLVELAIVVVIIGVVTVGAVKLIGGAVNNSKYTSTNSLLESLIKNLAQYAAKAQKLPADTELTLVTEEIRDAYGNIFFYSPDSAMVNPEVSGGLSSICSVVKTDTSVRICADAACSSVTKTVSDAAFFVASAGANNNFQFSKSGNLFTVYAQGVTVDGFSDDKSSPEAYDDFTGWMTLDTLKTYAGCEGYALSINQNELPPLIHGNKYVARLTPKGGMHPYQWCVESSDEQNAQTLTYSSSPLKNITDLNTCTDTDYVTGDYIVIKSDTMNIPDSSPASVLIRVKLKDGKGASLSKQYSVPVMKQYNLALAAKSSGGGTNNESDSGTGDFVSSNPNDNNNVTAPNKHSFLVTDESITIVMNSGQASSSAMIACSPDPASANPCPPFGNHGLLRAYFTLEKYDTTTDNTYYLGWTYPLGFVFTVLKSYVPGTTYTSTFGLTGRPDSGLGYGGSGGDPIGMRAGRSFGIEFDTRQDGGKNDKDDDHIAVVGYTDKTIYTSPRTYDAYSDNIHQTTTQKKSCALDTTGWVIEYNDPPDDSCGGKGFYYSSSSEVIPNSFPVLNRIGVRIEAVSGCNSTGTQCNAKTGANNYVCVFGWRQPESSMNNSSALKANMQNIAVSHAYNELSGITNPLGTPIIKDCYQDNTDTRDHLDRIRYGFTSSAWFTYDVGGGNTTYMPHYFKITDFAVKVTQY